ncbi:hypothetical protein [Sedimenticola sp.]
MLIDISFFNLLILVAVLVSCLAPVILLGLLLKDWKAGGLW